MLQTISLWNTVLDGLRLAVQFWWLWVPIILAIIAYDEWKGMTRTAHLAGLTWTLLEVIPPPDVPLSSPKAAENIFAGLHASYGGGTGWKSQFFKGEVPAWFSFEIVSNGGETHFYIRCQEKQRNVVESIIFAQYPAAEIRVVPDYVDDLPPTLDPDQYDLTGAELAFTKDAAFPIKTYIEFEEAGGKDEYARIDPLAPLMETMSQLRPGERLWLQYVIRATGGDWVKENQKVVDKLKGKKEPEAKPPLEWLFAPLDWLVGAQKEEKKEEKKEDFNLQKLTASERKVLESVEFKLAKLAFKTGIRLLYIAPKDAADGSRISGVTSMFKQLYFNNMNSFKPTMSKDKGILKWLFPGDVGFGAKARTAEKKAWVYDAYRKRLFTHDNLDPDKDEKLCILATDELATLWHLPGLNVKAPLMPRVQAKKGQPPAILPTRER